MAETAPPKPTIVVRVKEAVCDGDASYSPGTVCRVDREWALQLMKDRPGRFLEEATEADLTAYEKKLAAAKKTGAKEEAPAK